MFAMLFCINGIAQDIIIQGIVRDAFDNTGVENAQVQIFSSDSNLVDVGATKIPFITERYGNNARSYKDPNSGAVFEVTVPKGGGYTAVVSMMGYETKRVTFNVPEDRKKKLKIGEIYLFPQTTELDEVSVTATKLKMYHDGDTLVYNADAFVLNKRNVLEDLVKMLPGVELRDGRVFAQGKFIESIVISGKDVMPGDPMQLMKMLPAYIVGKLKFYDKQGEKSKTMNKDMLDDSYVMDVCLKRDYHTAWLGNADIGGGTEERWEGLGFVMRFDDRQYLSVSADANNIGEERVSNDLCTVSDNFSDSQDLTNKQVNLNYSYHPTDKFKFNVSGKAKKRDTDVGNEEKQRLLLDNSTDLYKLRSNATDRINDNYKGDVSMSIRPRKGVYGQAMYSFTYGKDTDDSKSRSVTSLHDINISDPAWQKLAMMQIANPDGITNIYTDSTYSSHRANDHNVRTEWHFALGDNLLRLKADYNMHLNDGTLQQRYTNNVYENNASTRRRNIHDTKIENITASMRMEYDINYIETAEKRGILMPYYSFLHKTSNDDRELVVFEPQDDGTEISCIDMNNSRGIRERLNAHTLGLDWTHEMQLRSKRWLVFNGKMPFEMRDVNVSLNNETASNSRHKQYALFSPSLEMKWYPKADDKNGRFGSLSLKGWCTQTTPKEIYLLDQTDTSDPLNTYLGNPDLQKQTEAGLSLGMRHTFEKNKHNTYAALSGTSTWNAIAVQSVYDKQSGMRTYMPVNVNGGYKLSADLGYSMPLASNQTCWLNLSAQSYYTRCANMMLDNNSIQGMDYMKLYGYRAKANLRWNNESRKVEVNYTITYSGNGIISNTDSNDGLQELTNNFSVIGDLPAGFDVSLFCTLVSRFGYITSTLNKTLLITSANISKSLWNDKVELCLSANDIFHQRKHINLVINGEGHIETIATKFVPAYIMASVYFNWSYTPKKKL